MHQEPLHQAPVCRIKRGAHPRFMGGVADLATPTAPASTSSRSAAAVAAAGRGSATPASRPQRVTSPSMSNLQNWDQCR